MGMNQNPVPAPTANDPFADVKTEMAKRYALLPEEIQKAIMSTDYQQKLFDLAKTHKLTYEELGTLELETTMVLLGMTRPEEYRDEVQLELKKNDLEIEALVKDVSDQVFNPIRGALDRVYSAKKEPEDYLTKAPSTGSDAPAMKMTPPVAPRVPVTPAPAPTSTAAPVFAAPMQTPSFTAAPTAPTISTTPSPITATSTPAPAFTTPTYSTPKPVMPAAMPMATTPFSAPTPFAKPAAPTPAPMAAPTATPAMPMSNPVSSTPVRIPIPPAPTAPIVMTPKPMPPQVDTLSAMEKSVLEKTGVMITDTPAVPVSQFQSMGSPKPATISPLRTEMIHDIEHPPKSPTDTLTTAFTGMPTKTTDYSLPKTGATPPAARPADPYREPIQ